MSALLEHGWMVNADPEVARLRERVRELEGALRPFVATQLGYASGVTRGRRWCSPRVDHDDMQRAREVLGGG